MHKSCASNLFCNFMRTLLLSIVSNSSTIVAFGGNFVRFFIITLKHLNSKNMSGTCFLTGFFGSGPVASGQKIDDVLEGVLSSGCVPR